VGAFLYATLQNELIVLFGLSGCLLIVGAMALNLMACAGFMRPLNTPGYLLKRKAALERHAKEQLCEKPPLDELKTAPVPGPISMTGEKSAMVAVDTKDCASAVRSDERDNGKTRGFLCRVAVVKLLKKKQQAYANYTHSLANILHDRVMVAFCVAVFLFSLGAFPPVLFMEDVAQSEGLVEGVCLIPLVSIVAITTGVGKLVLGTLADCKFINSIYLYAFSMVATSMALLCIPVTKTYVGLQVLSGVVGFFSGNWSLTSYITTKVVGLDRLTQAHGVLMLFGGFGISIGPPVVGTRPSPFRATTIVRFIDESLSIDRELIGI